MENARTPNRMPPRTLCLAVFAVAGFAIADSSAQDVGLRAAGFASVSSEDGIQAAIDALGDMGGIVYLPCGTVLLKKTLVIKHSMVLQGCGTSIGSPGEQF